MPGTRKRWSKTREIHSARRRTSASRRVVRSARLSVPGVGVSVDAFLHGALGGLLMRRGGCAAICDWVVTIARRRDTSKLADLNPGVMRTAGDVCEDVVFGPLITDRQHWHHSCSFHTGSLIKEK